MCPTDERYMYMVDDAYCLRLKLVMNIDVICVDSGKVGLVWYVSWKNDCSECHARLYVGYELGANELVSSWSR